MTSKLGKNHLTASSNCCLGINRCNGIACYYPSHNGHRGITGTITLRIYFPKSARSILLAAVGPEKLERWGDTDRRQLHRDRRSFRFELLRGSSVYASSHISRSPVTRDSCSNVRRRDDEITPVEFVATIDNHCRLFSPERLPHFRGIPLILRSPTLTSCNIFRWTTPT